MRRALVLAAAVLGASCYHDMQVRVEHQRKDLGKAMPAGLDPGARHPGEIRVARVRVWADADFRGHMAGWKRRVTEEIDYANEMFAPMLGVRLEVVGFQDWDYQAPTAPLRDTLAALREADAGDDVVWVIGFTGAVPLVTNAQHELGLAELLGKHVVIRGYSDAFERKAFLRAFPDLDVKDVDEVLAARRRHKQTVLLLHELGHTLGAIHEAAPESLLNPMYDAQETMVSERDRALMQLAIDDRVKLAELRDPKGTAAAMLASIEAQEWGGWIAADREDELAALHALSEAGRARQVAAAVPAATADQVAKAQALAQEGKLDDALAELAPLLEAYPGNAQIRLVACEIQLGPEGPPSAKAKETCTRAEELAQGDPSPYLAMAVRLGQSGDRRAARAQLASAGEKIDNLAAAARPAAWAQLAQLYQELGDVTHAEDAAAHGDAGAITAWARQTRVRYGDPRDGARWKITPDDEADYVDAVRAILGKIYADRFGDAAKAARAAEAKWPGAPGIAAARCDLALRQHQDGVAHAQCKAALAAFPDDSWALYLDGVLGLRGRDPKPGIASLRRAIAVDPELGQAWRTLATALERAGDRAALDQLEADYQAAFGQRLR